MRQHGEWPGQVVGDRVALWEIHRLSLENVLGDPGEDGRLDLGSAERQQPGRGDGTHRETEHVHGIEAEVIGQGDDVAGHYR
jgi:hypothetical protein